MKSFGGSWLHDFTSLDFTRLHSTSFTLTHFFALKSRICMLFAGFARILPPRQFSEAKKSSEVEGGFLVRLHSTYSATSLWSEVEGGSRRHDFFAPLHQKSMSCWVVTFNFFATLVYKPFISQYNGFKARLFLATPVSSNDFAHSLWFCERNSKKWVRNRFLSGKKSKPSL